MKNKNPDGILDFLKTAFTIVILLLSLALIFKNCGMPKKRIPNEDNNSGEQIIR